MTAYTIGSIALNIGTILYLFVYLPQISHNRKQQHLVNLSLNMHLTFYFAYMLDLIYGFAMHLQWQYKLVSTVGVCFVFIQHCQLTGLYWKSSNNKRIVQIYLLILVGTLIFMSYFFTKLHAHLSMPTIVVIGFVSRILFLSYTVPQIVKNYRLKVANAINMYFICLSLILSVLDVIASWCLDWGWPNKLGTPVMITFLLLLLIQYKKYPVPQQKSIG